MRPGRVFLPLALVLALAGCGQASIDSAEQFEGQERDVARVVEDLQSAGEQRDAEQICSEILARSLVDELRQAGTTCVQEMDDAMDDADDFELEVRDVTVSGDTATATVQRGDEESDTAVFEFERAGAGWRATSLAAAG